MVQCDAEERREKVVTMNSILNSVYECRKFITEREAEKREKRKREFEATQTQTQEKEFFLTFWSKNASNYTISQNIRVLLR